MRTPALQPWILPARGLAVFHGSGDVARLSHYFLPRLLLEGKRVLFLDGANCADPRLLARLARERGVPFEQFNRQIEIARAFTCFQLTELVARVPQFLRDFPAEVLIVTAFPDLYFDEDVRNWDARVAFEQAFGNLRRWAGHPRTEGRDFSPAGKVDIRNYVESIVLRTAGLKPRPSTCPSPEVLAPALKVGAALPLSLAVFSAASTFAPPPTRRRFFDQTCNAAKEVWKFSVDAENRLRLIGAPRDERIPMLERRSMTAVRVRRSPRVATEVPYGPHGCNFPRTD